MSNHQKLNVCKFFVQSHQLRRFNHSRNFSFFFAPIAVFEIYFVSGTRFSPFFFQFHYNKSVYCVVFCKCNNALTLFKSKKREKKHPLVHYVQTTLTLKYSFHLLEKSLSAKKQKYISEEKRNGTRARTINNFFTNYA
jgi:hypothetical protein